MKTEISFDKIITRYFSAKAAISGKNYSRLFTIQNVCRSTSTRAITGITGSSGSATSTCESGGEHDPSTQKVNVNISWTGADAITASEYVTRWRNQLCTQTHWSTAQPSGTTTCPSDPGVGEYFSSASNITTASDTLILCIGGC